MVNTLKYMLKVSVVATLSLLAACQQESNEPALEKSVVGTESTTKESSLKEKSWLSGEINFKTASATELEKKEKKTVVEEIPVEESIVEEQPIIEWEPESKELEIVESIVEEPVYEEPVPDPIYTYEVTSEEIMVPIPTQYVGDPQRDNDHMPFVQQYGQEGKIINTWLHTYEDGVLIDSSITKTSQVDPIPEIVIVGTNIVVIPESSSYEQELAKMKELFPGAFE